MAALTSAFFTGQRLAPRSSSGLRVSRQQVVTQARTLEAGWPLRHARRR